jgi:molybdenum cofactor cytidylyltransferase
MGSNKILLRLEGETLLRRAVRIAREAELTPVVVVLGPEAGAARRELSGFDGFVVENPDPSRGMHTSLAVGIAAVPPEAPAAVVLLADMPFVTAAMIAALADAFRRGSARLVLSDYAGVQAPPTLYGRELFAELAAADPGCGKAVIARHAERTERIPWPAAALADLDRPEDYERARASLEERGSIPCDPTC